MINKIIELLNAAGDIQIIPSYSSHKPPDKPYITYTIIDDNSPDIFGATETVYDNLDDKYIEKTEYRAETKIQFDVYVDKQEVVLKQTRKFKELILFILRQRLGYLSVGVLKPGKIKLLREDINSNYERRGSFDVTFEYMNLTEEREVLIAKEIELIINEKRKRIGGKNGNI